VLTFANQTVESLTMGNGVSAKCQIKRQMDCLMIGLMLSKIFRAPKLNRRGCRDNSFKEEGGL
jgi:hypothetical protein